MLLLESGVQSQSSVLWTLKRSASEEKTRDRNIVDESFLTMMSMFLQGESVSPSNNASSNLNLNAFDVPLLWSTLSKENGINSSLFIRKKYILKFGNQPRITSVFTRMVHIYAKLAPFVKVFVDTEQCKFVTRTTTSHTFDQFHPLGFGFHHHSW